MKRLGVVLTLLFCGQIVFAQYSQTSGKKVILPKDGRVKNAHWFVSPGMTYTLGQFGQEQYPFTFAPDSLGVDQMVSVDTYNPKGRIGAYLEIGRYHIIRRPSVFNYFDYSIAGKWNRGKEPWDRTISVISTNQVQSTDNGEGNFSAWNITGNFNINAFQQLTNTLFLQHSLGAHLDYRILGSTNTTNALHVNSNVVPEPLHFRFHYKLGFGYKASSKMLIIPSLELPLLSLVPIGQFGPTLDYFNSWYYPTVLSVRFLFIGKADGIACPGNVHGKKQKKGKDLPEITDPSYR